MDPVSILGAASASTALLKLIAGAVRDLMDVQNKLQQADRAVQLLIEELSSLGVALTQIQSWAERVRAADHTRESVVCGLNNTLKGCKAAMDDLAKNISPLVKNVSLVSRLKFVWKEADIKDHQARLQSLKISLILSLFAAQCELSLAGPASPTQPESATGRDQEVGNRAESKRATDAIRLSRSYFKGRPISADKNITGAPVPSFGIYYLPGTDVKDVERAESNDISGQKPDQLTPLWRINTAGSLLNEILIHYDLSFELKDRTREILANASHPPNEHPARNFTLWSCCTQRKTQSQLLATAFTCTVDSDNVKLLNPSQTVQCDLQSTLIEVDAGNLFLLLTGFRGGIKSLGASASDSDILEYVSAMMTIIHDLYRKSPTLLRMSTRARIIHAKEIHYGMNLHSMFQTITTSAGILEFISLLSSYCMSLHQHSDFDAMRPQFLQTNVLLLALLTDRDLEKAKDYIQLSHGLKIDRFNLEMLILKVLPLMSTNSEAFMKGLESTFHGLTESAFSNQEYGTYWKFFIEQVARKGYLLPVTASNPARKGPSWLATYPRDGLTCSTTFSLLQFSEHSSSKFNDIPPIRFDDGSFGGRVLVVLQNQRTYWVDTSDQKKIVRWHSGTYMLLEEVQEERKYNLTIKKRNLMANLCTVADHLENLRVEFNIQVALARREQTSTSEYSFPEIRKLDPLEPIYVKEALLEPDLRAKRYEISGLVITRKDAYRTFKAELRRLEQAIQSTKKITDTNILNITKDPLQLHLDRAIESLAYAKATNPDPSSLGVPDELLEEIVVRWIDPESLFELESKVWFEYRAWFETEAKFMHFHGHHDIVRRVEDALRGSLKVLLASGMSLTIASLIPTKDASSRNEIQVDDDVVLMGQYLVIVSARRVEQESGGSSLPPRSSMKCFMKILHEDDLVGYKARPRRQKAKADAHYIFR